MSGPPAGASPRGARLRAARIRVARTWTDGDPRTRSALALGGVVAAALFGAFLFGAWHVVFGGLVKGNWRAGAFGAALSGVTGVLLWIAASAADRLLPPGRR